jgi:hypothetical protein
MLHHNLSQAKRKIVSEYQSTLPRVKRPGPEADH